jgi:alcohol dehydrogenase class IV
MQFTYYMPVRILAGQGCLYENRALLLELGKKALIVTGKHSAKGNGAYDDAVRALEANGQRFFLYDAVMSNPTVDCAFDAAEAAKQEGCDCILAIGGGSPLDIGKAAAALAVNALEKEAIFTSFSARCVRALPVAAVPTTAGTGSEVTQYAILTNHAGKTKTSIASPALFPRFAFLDAQYTRTLNRTITINTAVDALSHLIEGMLSLRASVLSDGMAKNGIRAIAGCFNILGNPELAGADRGLPLRETLLGASTLGGMVIANTGTTAVHAMGYQLTYFKNIEHGRANGLLLGAFLRFIQEKQTPWGTERINAILTALGMGSIDAFDALLRALLGPVEIYADQELAGYAEGAGKAKNIANCPLVPEKQDILMMLRQSLGRR